MSIGWSEVLVIFFLILLLFGGKKLPELARSMGKAVNEFRHSLNETVEKTTVEKNSAKDDGLNGG